MKTNFYHSCAAWLGRWVRRPWTSTPEAPALSKKVLVIFTDGRTAIVNNTDEAHSLVMSECMKTGKMVAADWRPATVDEAAALSSPNVSGQPRAEDRP